MANYSIKWDETAPLGTSSKSLGDNYLRDNLTAVRERLDTEHTNVTGSSGDAWLMHSWAVVAKSADYIATSADHVILVTTGASAITITLPTAVGITGKPYKIKKADAGAGTVVIDGNSSETIDGAATLTLTNQYDFADIVSDGANWVVVSKPAVNLDWDTAFTDAVHTHTSDAEGGLLSIVKFIATPTNLISWTAFTDWTDVNISTNTGTDTAKAALINMSATGLGQAGSDSNIEVTGWARKNGSSDVVALPRVVLKARRGSVNHTMASCSGMFIVECDASEIFEVKFENVANGTNFGVELTFKVDLIGYII